jgi:lipid-A-disaccharide synthase-like uncharacterized protein
MSAEQFWLSVGLAAQAFFSMRFVVQWIVSERRKASVMPVAFWLFSVCGGLMLLTYAIHRRDPVFIVGEVVTTSIYLRNLQLLWRARRQPPAAATGIACEMPTRPIEPA